MSSRHSGYDRLHHENRNSDQAADWGQIRALFAAGLHLDLRSARAGQRSRLKIPAMVSMLATYAIIGSILALSLVRTSDPFTFTLLTFSAAMFMTAITVIMEYSSVVVSPNDYDILAHRPVSSRTYYFAKVANLLFYVACTATALNLPAAIVVGFRFDGGAAVGFLYMIMALIACFAAAALVVLLYSTALKLFDYQRFNRAITYVHLLATLALTFGYVLLPRMLIKEDVTVVIEKGPWIWFAPPAWYAGGVELSVGLGDSRNLILALLAIASAVVVIHTALTMISLEYSRSIGQLTESSPEETIRKDRRKLRTRFAALGIVFCRNDEEKAGFQLMQAYMRRNGKLRLRIYPAFGLPLAVYLFGLVSGGLNDPLGPRSLENAFPVRELLGFYCVFITLFFASAITQSDQWKASWIFFAAPVENRVGLLIGARKLVIWRYMTPFFCVLLVLLSFAMPPVSATLYLFVTFVLSLTTFALLSMASPFMPLSQSIEKTRQARQMGLIMLLGIAMVFLVAITETLREARLAGTIAVVLLLALAGLSEIALRKRLTSRLAGEEFLG
jgi:hypothetical protein